MVVNMIEHTRHNVLLAELSGCSQEDLEPNCIEAPGNSDSAEYHRTSGLTAPCQHGDFSAACQ